MSTTAPIVLIVDLFELFVLVVDSTATERHDLIVDLVDAFVLTADVSDTLTAIVDTE